MESRAKLFGHAAHPILIVFPLGLLATAVIFDIISILTDMGGWSEIAFWMIAAGIIGGLVAGIFGLIDWLAIPSNTRAKTIGLWHGLGNVVVIGLFIVSWILRAYSPADPGAAAYVLSFAGAGLALVTGWLGGELVERLGVGVDDGAHLNAPSSLSNRPVSESVTGGRGIIAGGPEHRGRHAI
ncbi:MAG TPA: DUF2231 domain-containing protein [Blastocatellia bacterium]